MNLILNICCFKTVFVPILACLQEKIAELRMLAFFVCMQTKHRQQTIPCSFLTNLEFGEVLFFTRYAWCLPLLQQQQVTTGWTVRCELRV
jgi:hypothetical protein